MAVDPWSNDACRGYVIWTMENSGFKPKEITQAVTELYTAFDFQTIEEVARHYYNSSFLLRVKLELLINPIKKMSSRNIEMNSIARKI